MSTLRQLLKSAFTTALPQSWLMTHGPRRQSRSHAPRGNAGVDALRRGGNPSLEIVTADDDAERRDARSHAERGNESRVPRGNEIVEFALTFDDGPHPEHTPRLLDVLGASGAKGTFFVIGEQALRYPQLIRRMADEGHEIGNHTWTHSEPSRTSAARFLQEVAQTRRLIQNLTGRDCRLMRPPKGALSVGKALGLWRQQQTIALWNIDPQDFAMTDETEMLGWLNGYRPQSGDIVLLHDNHPHAAIAAEWLTSGTVAALARVRENARRFVTLSEWLSSRPHPACLDGAKDGELRTTNIPRLSPHPPCADGEADRWGRDVGVRHFGISELAGANFEIPKCQTPDPKCLTPDREVLNVD